MNPYPTDPNATPEPERRGGLREAYDHLRYVSDPGAPKPQTAMEIHNAHVTAMEENFVKTGRWIDPVSGKEFPRGQLMKRDPNREERRRLERWRKTSGKVAPAAGSNATPIPVGSKGSSRMSK